MTGFASRVFGVVVTLCALAALAVSPAAAQQERGKLQKVVVATPGPALHFFPAHVADAAGLFESEGLDVEWVDVGAGSRQVAAVASGSAAMTVLGMQPAITASERGAELVAFAALFNKYPIQLLLHPDVMKRLKIDASTPIDEKVKKLAGLKIGITGVGSSSDSVLRVLLKARGHNPDTMLQIQPVGSPPAVMAAMEKKIVDGAMLSAPQAQILIANGSATTLIDPLTGEAPEFNGVPYTGMITTREYIQKNPDVVMRATRALAKAMLLESRNPDQAAQLMHKKLFADIDPKLFASFEPTYRSSSATTPVITPEDYQRLVKWMSILDGKSTPVSYDKMINTDFAKRAAADILGK